MRLIGHLPDEKLARRFADYLLVKQVASQVEPEADGRWAVWVHDDDHVDDASDDLSKFRDKPADRTYITASAKAAEQRLKEERDAASQADREYDRQRMFQKSFIERLGYCTSLLILICVVVFAIQLVNETPVWNWLAMEKITPVEGDRLSWNDQGFLPEVRHGQMWRLVTPVFVHGGFLHLLMNMFLFAQLSSAIERRYGWNRLLPLVIVVAVFSNMLQYVFEGPAFCGLSGVVFGLFGFIWIQWKYYPNSGFIVPPNLTFIMLFWFVLCIVGLGGSIANFVHWGGLASGAVIGYVTARLSRV